MNRVIHFEIHSANPEETAKFYTQVFGWEISKWSGEVPYWLIKTGAAPEAGIDGGITFRRGPAPVDGQAVNAFVCTLGVEDVSALVEKVVASGGSVAMPKGPVPGVGWLAYVKDLDGNILGLMQADPNAA